MSVPTLAVVVDLLDHLQRRVVQDAIASATAATWRRRADMFMWAAPQPEDFVGEASPAEIEERRRRCLKLAALCAHRADLAEGGGESFPQLTCPTCLTPTSPWSCSCGETRIGGTA